jgi:hypothetical protein
VRREVFESTTGVPKTHDCEALLTALLGLEPLWSPWKNALARLSDYAVRLRYPGVYATKSEAKQAMKDCKAIRKEVRHSLGLR